MIDMPIYFDYMSTTPIDPQVITRMLEYMGPRALFGNAGAVQHAFGQQAARAIEDARSQIADTVGATSDDIIFTSGATEANNLAILGAARFYQRKGRHIITMTTEHQSVLNGFRALAQEGFEVTYLDPESDGLLNPLRLQEALRDDTILVSIMQVNNEIGVIQDIATIGQMLRGKGIVFHVDAAQSVGRVPINLDTLPVDLMTFSAHKAYGPKGIGALFVRHKPRIRLTPLSFGGGQEQGLRSGTLPTHQIIGMGEAFALAEKLRETEETRLLALRHQLWDGIKHIPGIQCNGNMISRIAGNLSMSFQHHTYDTILHTCHTLAISTMSACTAAHTHASHVLRALRLNETLAAKTIRLSFGRFTTEEDIQIAISTILKMTH